MNQSLNPPVEESSEDEYKASLGSSSGQGSQIYEYQGFSHQNSSSNYEVQNQYLQPRQQVGVDMFEVICIVSV